MRVKKLLHTRMRVSDMEQMSSRFLFIDAPDGYEIELIERPSGVAIV